MGVLSSSTAAAGRLAWPRLRHITATAALGLALAGKVLAAGFPDHPVQLVISFPPGGATDVLSRELALHMGNALGQSVVVVNKPGAAGLIGMQTAANSPADGYTVYMASIATNSINEALHGKKRPALDTDFDPVRGVATAPHILVISGKLAVNSLQDLVKLVKSAPGQHNYASNGAGTLANFEGEALKEQTGMQAVQIPYKGTAQALPEVMNGSSSFMFDSPATSLPHRESGRIKILAVASPKRLPVIPDIPTFKELGVQGLDQENLFSLFVPKGTPADRVQALVAAVDKARSDDGFRKAIAKSGFDVSNVTQAELPKFVREQQEFFGRRVRELKITGGE
jgi:tripartite-type tricarboxylate transporter receptor subunit TctC